MSVTIIGPIPKNWRKGRRLGDTIASIANPIAGVIDKVAGSNLAGCGGCSKMKKRLNDGMPIKEAIKLRIQGK